MALDPGIFVIGGGLMDHEATTPEFRERYLRIIRETARPYLWPQQRGTHQNCSRRARRIVAGHRRGAGGAVSQPGLITDRAIQFDNSAIQFDNRELQIKNSVVQIENSAIQLDSGALQFHNSAVQIDSRVIQQVNRVIQLDNGVIQLDNGPTEQSIFRSAFFGLQLILP